jgi:hypothetical protein
MGKQQQESFMYLNFIQGGNNAMRKKEMPLFESQGSKSESVIAKSGERGMTINTYVAKYV